MRPGIVANVSVFWALLVCVLPVFFAYLPNMCVDMVFRCSLVPAKLLQARALCGVHRELLNNLKWYLVTRWLMYYGNDVFIRQQPPVNNSPYPWFAPVLSIEFVELYSHMHWCHWSQLSNLRVNFIYRFNYDLEQQLNRRVTWQWEDLEWNCYSYVNSYCKQAFSCPVSLAACLILPQKRLWFVLLVNFSVRMNIKNYC